MALSRAAAKPMSTTWRELGKTSERALTRLLARFSSKRSLGSGSGDAEDPPLALRRERKTGADVIARQLRKIDEDFSLGHTRRQIREDVPHGDAGPADTRLPEANLRIECDPTPVIHAHDRRLVLGRRASADAFVISPGAWASRSCPPNGRYQPRPKAVGCMPWFGASVPLSVSIASVSYDADVHEARVVVERVDDSVVSDANSPKVGRPLKLDASTRPWLGRQSLDTRDDPPHHAGLQAFEFAPSRAREDNGVLSHAAAGDLRRAS